MLLLLLLDEMILVHRVAWEEGLHMPTPIPDTLCGDSSHCLVLCVLLLQAGGATRLWCPARRTPPACLRSWRRLSGSCGESVAWAACLGAVAQGVTRFLSQLWGACIHQQCRAVGRVCTGFHTHTQCSLYTPCGSSALPGLHPGLRSARVAVVDFWMTPPCIIFPLPATGSPSSSPALPSHLSSGQWSAGRRWATGGDRARAPYRHCSSTSSGPWAVACRWEARYTTRHSTRMLMCTLRPRHIRAHQHAQRN